jgi:hypothetical protein
MLTPVYTTRFSKDIKRLRRRKKDFEKPYGWELGFEFTWYKEWFSLIDLRPEPSGFSLGSGCTGRATFRKISLYQLQAPVADDNRR